MWLIMIKCLLAFQEVGIFLLSLDLLCFMNDEGIHKELSLIRLAFFGMQNILLEQLSVPSIKWKEIRRAD
jgi:hypothetical protein